MGKRVPYSVMIKHVPLTRWTSRHSYDVAQKSGLSQTQCDLVLDALRVHKLGLTDREISRLTGVPRHLVPARRADINKCYAEVFGGHVIKNFGGEVRYYVFGGRRVPNNVWRLEEGV